MSEGKSVFASKTLWFNILTGGLELLQVVSGLSMIPHEWVVMGNAFGNIVLRFVTTEPIRLK